MVTKENAFSKGLLFEATLATDVPRDLIVYERHAEECFEFENRNPEVAFAFQNMRTERAMQVLSFEVKMATSGAIEAVLFDGH